MKEAGADTAQNFQMDVFTINGVRDGVFGGAPAAVGSAPQVKKLRMGRLG